MDQTLMKTRPVFPLVASMSLPMVLSMLVNSLYNIVDGFFVARISGDAMTALSLVFPVQNLITAVTVGFSIGVSAMISRCLGAGEQAEADGAAAQGLALSAVHGVALTAVSVSLMPFFLGMFTTDGAVLELGLQYARTAFAFAPVIALGMTFEKIFQSGGRMTVTMLCMLAGCVTNILLDPLLIFGPGPFPAMGMYGAALATGLGQAVNLALYMILYAARPLHVRLRRRDALPRRETAGRLYAVGAPAALSMALPSLLIAALNLILSGWGQSYVLILGAYYKLQTFLYLPANGIVQGLRPLIGYNYGAGEQKRVREIFRAALALTAGIMLAGTLLSWAVPERLMGLFITSGATVEEGARALRIISAGFLVSAVSVIASGALEGLGMGRPSLWISLARYGVFMIPAAFFLSRRWGPAGVWHAFWVTELAAAALSLRLFRERAGKGPDGADPPPEKA